MAVDEKTFAVTLETLAPLHIGGRDNPLTGMENAVATVAGRLVVPGPSFKGALRHQIERYLIETYYDATRRQWPAQHAALQPCMAGAGDISVEETQLVAAGKYRATVQGNQRRSGCVYPTMGGICPVCYLLGAQGLTGFLRLSFITSPADERAAALYAGRVNRSVGTIAHGTNRPYELAAPGLIFTGKVTILQQDAVRNWTFGRPRRPAGAQQTPDLWLDGQTDWTAQRILDELVLKRLEAIHILGGYRSKGFGDVKVTVKEE